MEKNKEYLKSKNINTSKKGIMIATDGKYTDFI